MASWVRESLNDLQPGLSVTRTAKFSVLNVGGTRAASMADAADVVMSEAPKAVPDAKASKKGGGKQKGGAASSTAAEAPAKKGRRDVCGERRKGENTSYATRLQWRTFLRGLNGRTAFAGYRSAWDSRGLLSAVGWCISGAGLFLQPTAATLPVVCA